MAYASSNPWDVPQIDSFNFLCCPECVYRSKDEGTFQVRFILLKLRYFGKAIKIWKKPTSIFFFDDT